MCKILLVNLKKIKIESEFRKEMAQYFCTHFLLFVYSNAIHILSFLSILSYISQNTFGSELNLHLLHSKISLTMYLVTCDSTIDMDPDLFSLQSCFSCFLLLRPWSWLEPCLRPSGFHLCPTVLSLNLGVGASSSHSAKVFGDVKADEEHRRLDDDTISFAFSASASAWSPST